MTTPAIDLYQLALDQTNSEEIEAYRTSVTGIELQDVPFQDVSLLQGDQKVPVHLNCENNK